MKRFARSGWWTALCVGLTLTLILTLSALVFYLGHTPESVVQHTEDTYLYLRNVLWGLRILFSAVACMGGWLIRFGKHKAGALALEAVAWILMVLLVFCMGLLVTGTADQTRQGMMDRPGVTGAMILAYGLFILTGIALFFSTKALRIVINHKRSVVEGAFYAGTLSIVALVLVALVLVNVGFAPAVSETNELVWPGRTDPFYSGFTAEQLYVLSLYANTNLLTALLPPNIGITAGSPVLNPGYPIVFVLLWSLIGVNARRFLKGLEKEPDYDVFFKL